jgi:hypothetical protein
MQVNVCANMSTVVSVTYLQCADISLANGGKRDRAMQVNVYSDVFTVVQLWVKTYTHTHTHT